MVVVWRSGRVCLSCSMKRVAHCQSRLVVLQKYEACLWSGGQATLSSSRSDSILKSSELEAIKNQVEAEFEFHAVVVARP
jgi:hypothetical protein